MNQRQHKSLEIELNRLDWQYEYLRVHDRTSEERLLVSIAERGIQKSIQGIWDREHCLFIVLNGFRRTRDINTLAYLYFRGKPEIREKGGMSSRGCFRLTERPSRQL